jgi:hypothetical protein
MNIIKQNQNKITLAAIILFIGYILTHFAIFPGKVSHIDGQFYMSTIAIYSIILCFVSDRWLRGFLIYFTVWVAVLFIFSIVDFVVLGKFYNAFEMYSETIVAVILWIFVSRLPENIIIKKKVFNVTTCIYNLICIMALVEACIAWMQYFGFDLYPYLFNVVSNGWVTGTVTNQNFLAAYLVISIPFFLRKSWCFKLIPIGLIPVIPVLFFTHTATAVIALCAGMVFFFYNPKNKQLNINIITIAILSAYLYTFKFKGLIINFDEQFTRPSMWLSTWNFTTSNFYRILIGESPGLVSQVNIHNEYLTMFLKFGIIGIGFIVEYIKNLYRENKILFSAMVIILVDAVGNFPFEIPLTLIQIIIIAGLIERERLWQINVLR